MWQVVLPLVSMGVHFPSPSNSEREGRERGEGGIEAASDEFLPSSEPAEPWRRLVRVEGGGMVNCR